MRCPGCRHDNPPQAKFCAECGSALRAHCVGCAAEIPAGANFCPKCGRPLEVRLPQEGEARTEPPRGRAPRDYTPKHLAEKILTSKSALEGERKQVTVLFADVKGSLELAEQVDPEEWHRILNRFFEILSDGVHRFEGTVNQYTGDGIMALFGAPIAHEDHARRACYAALHLTDELRRYAETLKRTQGLTFAVRMGLNSGEVVVGKIGDDLRMDYTAQGQTVGLAARLEQLADPGKVYLSEGTANLVSGFFHLRDLGRFDLKGMRERPRVYELEGVGELRTRLEVSRERGLSRFVGRAAETETLERALAHAVDGNAQLVGVVGDAGVGKSRLCCEFLERCRARGLRVREAHGVAHGKSVPFLPVLEFLRGFFSVSERDTDEEARRKIAGTLLLLDRDLTESLPLLFEFLGVPDPKQPAPPMDLEARQRNLFTLVRRTLQARNREEPGVILLEDLHWIDAGSEAFIENLVEALPGTRTLLLVNFRPEYHASWMQKSYYQQLPLLPLGAAEIRELLDHLLGRDPSLAGLTEGIRDRTGGNPFFIEEVIQSLVEAGSLEGARGAYRLSRRVEAVAIPASVQAVLAARIDRLGEREKHLLQTAAVIGREFPEPILKEAADLPDVDLADSLRLLAGAEFIYEASLYPELAYAFKHPLTQEVAYHSQLADRRARVHGAVARAIAERHPEKQAERAALVAHHWEGAGEPLEAARWHARAGEWTGFRDPGEALRHWRRVRTLLGEVPESPETLGLGLMARIQILNFGFRTGLETAETARIFEEGKALAERTGNKHAIALLMQGYGAFRLLAGDIREAAELREEALRLAEEAGDPGLTLVVQNGLLFSYLFLGRLREALAVADRILAQPPDDPRIGAAISGYSPYIRAFLGRGMILNNLGRLEEGLRDMKHCLELAQAHGEQETLGWLHGNYPLIGFLTGEHQDALAHARQSFEIAEKIGSPFSRIMAYWALGAAHQLNEEWREAREAYEQALGLSQESQAGLMMLTQGQSSLAICYLALGEHQRAREAAEQSTDWLHRRDSKVDEARGYLTKARVLRTIEGEKARMVIEAAIANAMKLIRETGARIFEPFVHEERAELAALLHDDATRTSELREAHRLFTEMGATGHAARLARELE